MTDTADVHWADPDGPTEEDVERFVHDGVLGVREAVPRALAEQCRDLVLGAAGVDPGDRSTWTVPVIRTFEHQGGLVLEAAHSPRLLAATDAVVGAGRWVTYAGMGSFVIRLPHPDDPGDDGWHVDASLPPDGEPDSTDYLRWGVNARSEGRAVLWLMLFSDVGPDDAPTRLRLGSHLELARQLVATGDATASPYPLPPLDHLPVALATGHPGDVFLCHPFLVHAAQRHRGSTPRVLAQPGRPWTVRPDPEHPGGAVEDAIRRASHS